MAFHDSGTDVPASRVVHLVGQATGMNAPRPTRRVPTYWLAARRRYFLKHHGRLRTLAADVLWALGRASWRLRSHLQRKPDPDPPKMLVDFVRHTLAPRKAR